MRACTWIFALVGAVLVSAGCGDDDSGRPLDAGTCAVTCDDNNLCNGVETCRDGSCAPGQPLPDGASCGTGMVCRASACVSARCGNGLLDADEECDDGNATNGDGCDSTCKFSCLSTDATRSCASSNECVTGGVCNDTTHTCTTGAPVADNTACPSGGPNNYCVAGVCTAPSCGNGKTEPGEECDDSNTVDGDGCDSTCRFSCVSTDAARGCPASNDCVTDGVCSDATHTCTPGAPVPDNQACSGGPNNYCLAGVCKTPECGNNVIERGEDCEGGPGCTTSCTFLCTSDPANQCPGTPAPCSAFVCASDHSCTTAVDESQDGQFCDQAGNVCFAGSCIAPECGNGRREGNEQCDDGGTLNLDGCDSACQFEEDQRVTSLQQQFSTDPFCPQNALGTAITPDAQSTIQATWDIPIADGTISIVFKFLGLRDLTGGDTPFTLGFVQAAAVRDPVAGRVVTDNASCGNGVCEESTIPGTSEAFSTCPLDCTYDGTNDLDWWYVRDPASVDASETPLVQLPGQITSGVLTAGPGTISLSLLFALQPATVKLFNTRVQAQVDGAVNAPTPSQAGTTPGHLASEHLVSTLRSVSGSTTGAMCSDVSAASLFNTPIPPLLLLSCAFDDAGFNPMFTEANTLLDVFVAGCNVFSVPGVLPTQPDGSQDGARYQFTLDGSRTVTGCTRDGAPAELQSCLDAATFSSYFKFAADRVIIRRN